MKYAAVVFDLFGTLVDNFSLREIRGVLMRMASIVSAPSDDFVQLWFDTFNERGTGVFKSGEDNIKHICRELGVNTEDAQIKQAAQIRHQFTVHSLKPRADAVEVLSYLKSEDYKTGLITDCSSEVPAIWKDIPFAPMIDVALFSCQIGMKKPDPRIYQLAIEQLAIRPSECLYIGDGSSQELTGAAQAGMHPVLINIPNLDITDVHRIDSESDEWNGSVISSLREVVTLLK